MPNSNSDPSVDRHHHHQRDFNVIVDHLPHTNGEFTVVEEFGGDAGGGPDYGLVTNNGYINHHNMDPLINNIKGMNSNTSGSEPECGG